MLVALAECGTCHASKQLSSSSDRLQHKLDMMASRLSPVKEVVACQLHSAWPSTPWSVRLGSSCPEAGHA